MSDETSPAADPVPGPRYFTKDGEGVQVVYNLRDATPYVDLGYREVGEEEYRASLPDPADVSPFPVAD